LRWMMPVWPRKGLAVANIVSIHVTSINSTYGRGNIALRAKESNGN